LAFTLHVKALGLISEFQPMRSTDFDNLKQQNGLDSSCKAALRYMCAKSHIHQSCGRLPKKLFSAKVPWYAEIHIQRPFLTIKIAYEKFLD
jgi:hypothetical protein